MEYTFKSIDEFEVIDGGIADRYSELIVQLKGKEFHTTINALEEVRSHRDSELLLCMLDEQGAIAGMAQASFSCTPAKYSARINNVVIDEKYRGQGLGSVLMNELEKRARERWSRIQGFMLTSAPRRGTQGFYLRLGYRMRTKEAGDETIVYVKDIPV